MGMRMNRNDYDRTLRLLREIPRKIELIMIKTLSVTGELTINKIKDRPKDFPNWTDRSGNLRSSIGYAVFVDGVERKVGGFDLQNNTGTNPSSGIGVGQDFADQYAKSLNMGRYTLIIVAGMNYATYVEKKDYDVLLFVESEAKRIVEDQLRIADQQIQQEINRLSR